MSERFVLYRADPSGTADDLASFPELPWALRRRDKLRERSDRTRAHYGVRDGEDPERGDLDWPEDSGRRARRTSGTRSARSRPALDLDR